MRRNAVRIAALAFAAFALTARAASAQGYGVYEHDACTMGRAGTGVANPCNASAVFFNPAGIVHRAGSTGTRWNLAIGATSIGADFTFADSASGVNTPSAGGAIMVPNMHITRQFKERWAFGLGVFAPYGLVSEWPAASDFPGRFLGYRSELKSIYIQPTLAVRVNNWLQLGAGVDYIRSSVDLKQRIDLSTQVAGPGVTFANLGVPVGTDFADANLTGNSWSAGAHLGVIVRPVSRLAIGARYLLKAKADIQGNAFFTQLPTGITLGAGNPLGRPAGTPMDSVVAPQFRTGGALIQQHVSTNVPLPDQIVVGTSVDVTSKLTVLFDYQWTNWSKFSKLQITFAQTALGTQTLWEDYRDTYGIRFGAEYDVTPNITVRGGLLFHEGAAPSETVTPLLPEAERAEQTVGLSFRLMRNARIDVAYQHINQADRRGRVVSAPRGSSAFNTGLYTGSANLFGASLAWGF